MSPRTGRPKSDRPKATQLGVRLTNEELSQLDQCVSHYQVTRAEVLRLGLKKLYEDMKKEQNV